MDTFRQLYFTLIRSILEYELPIWSPYTKYNINFIEDVLNRFLKFVAFKFNITVDQYDLTVIRSLLNFPTLASRRKLADISFIYKLFSNHINAHYLLNFILFNNPTYYNIIIIINSHVLLAITQHKLSKNSSILRAIALCNKLDVDVDFFFFSVEKDS